MLPIASADAAYPPSQITAPQNLAFDLQQERQQETLLRRPTSRETRRANNAKQG